MRDELLTIQEAAEFFGVSTRTLRRWEQKGYLVAQRTLGNQRRYSKNQLAALFKMPELNEPLKTQDAPAQAPAPKVEWIGFQAQKPAPQQPSAPVQQTPVEATPAPVPSTTTVNGFQLPKNDKDPEYFGQQRFVMAFATAAALLLVFFLSAIAFANLEGLGKGRDGFVNLIRTKSNNASQTLGGKSVLAAEDRLQDLVMNVNVPGLFGRKVTFLDDVELKKNMNVTGLSTLAGGVNTQNANINAGTGTVTASNLVYSVLAGSNISITGDPQNPTISADLSSVNVDLSNTVSSLQGQTGALSLAEGNGIGLDGLTISNTGVLSVQGQTGAVSFSSGDGISLSGFTITNSDPGSAQKIFGIFDVAGTSIEADANTDTISFAAGSGISLTPDAGTKTITITSTANGTLSGLTTNGVLYATSSNNATSTDAGTNGYVLKSNGAGSAPTWVAPGTLLGTVQFDILSSGTNTTAAMVVGSGASLGYTGTGTIAATSLLGSTWATPGAIGSTTANTGAFTTLTANTINGLAVTPNGSNTLTIAAGKTLTVNNTLTLAGTDGTSFTFPGASDTLVGRASTDTLTNKTIDAGSNTITGLTNANLSGSAGITNANLANSSVTVTAGTGMSGGGAVSLGGSVTLNNAGVTSAAGGTGISVDVATGDITITNTGVTSLAGTANQVSVSGGTGAVTLSLPQNIHSAATPTFGGLTLSTLTNNGGILYTNGTGTIAQTSVGSPGQCLTSAGGGSPTWATCAASNYWQIDQGALSPTNSTLDLLIGGTATASAKFAFMNVTGSGTPTASISAGAAGGMYITAAGNLQTTANQTMTFGGSSTGNIILNGDGNNYVGIGSSSPASVLDVTVSTANGLRIYNAARTKFMEFRDDGTNIALLPGGAQGANVFGLTYFSGNIDAGSNALENLGSLSIGNNNFGQLATVDARGTSGTLPVASFSAQTANAAVVVVNDGVGDLFVASKSGATKFVIDNQGHVGIGSSTLPADTELFVKALSGQNADIELSDGNGANNWSIVAETNGRFTIYDASNDLNPVNIEEGTPDNTLYLDSTGNIGIGIANATSKLQVAGNIEALNGSQQTLLTDSGSIELARTTNDAFIDFKTSTGEDYDARLGAAAGGLGIRTSSSATDQFLFESGGNFGIGTTDPISAFHLTRPLSYGANGKALAIFDQNENQDIFTASASGTTRLTLANNGNLNLIGTYYANGVAGITQGSASCVTTTNGIVTGFGTCQLGSEQWEISNGAIYTGNPSLDLLLGGTSTASARFAVTNMVGAGTPTASISANSGNIATYLTGNGHLGTTNRQSLTIGNSSTYDTTGNVLIHPSGSGRVEIGAATSGDATLKIKNNTDRKAITIRPVAGQTANMFEAYGTTGNVNFYLNEKGELRASPDADNSTAFRLKQFSNTQSANLTEWTDDANNVLSAFDDDANLRLGGSAADAGKLNIAGAFTGKALVIFNETGNQDIFSASASGTTRFTIANNGQITLGASAYQNCTALETVNGVIGCGTDDTGVTTNYWQLNNGSISPFSNTADLFVGGTSTASAKFSVLNMTGSGTPTASVSATSTGNGISFGGDGVIQSLRNNNLVLGGSTTGSIVMSDTVHMLNNSLTSVDAITINDPGPTEGLTFGNTTANWSVDVSPLNRSNADGNLNFYGTANNIALWRPSLWVYDATNYTTATAQSDGGLDFTTTGTGDISFSPGGNVGIGTTSPDYDLDIEGNVGGNGTVNARIYNTNASGFAELYLDSDSRRYVLGTGGSSTVGANTFYIHDGTANATRFAIDSSGRVGIGNGSNASLLGTLDVRGVSGTQPIASLSGSSTFAGMVVDNNGTGDLFTASKSGATKFVIKNNGYIGIGTATPRSTLDLGQDGSALTIGGLSARAQINFGSTTGDNSIKFSNNEYGLYTSQSNGFRFYADTGSDTATPELIIASNGSITLGASGYANCTALETVGNVLTCGTDDTGSTTNYWQLNNGAISPFSNTADLLIGGTSTASAKFAVTNMTGSGTPTASVSAGTTGATYLTAAGTLQTTANQTLTLGGSSTGNIILNGDGNNSVGIGLLNPSQRLQVSGNVQVDSGFYYASPTGSSQLLLASGGNYGTVQNDGTNVWSLGHRGTLSGTLGTSVLSWNASNQVGIGTTSPLATLDVRGQSVTLPIASVSGATTFAGMVVDNTGTGDLFTASKSGATKLVITNSGNLSIGTTTEEDNKSITVNSRANAALILNADTNNDGSEVGNAYIQLGQDGSLDRFFGTIQQTGNSPVGAGYTGTLVNATLIGNTGSDALQFGTSNAVRATFDTAGRLGLNTNSPLGTFDVRGANGTEPVASISGSTTRAALIVDNNGTGDLLTASKSGATKFVIANSGNVGINVAAPTELLHLNGKIKFFDATENATVNGNAKIFVGAGPDSSADGNLTSQLTNINNYGAGGNGLVFQYGGGDDSGGIKIADDGLVIWGAGDDDLFRVIDEDANSVRLVVDDTGNIGVGTTGPLAKLEVNGAGSGTLPIASFSGTTTFAGMVVDNNGTGDLFVASKSGATKFVVKNNGDIGLAAGQVIDTLSPGTLGIGTTNATTLTIGRSGQGITLPGFNNCGMLTTSGTTLTCSGAPAGSTQYLRLNSGAFSLVNDTTDFLFGGVASSSAKFKLSPSGTAPTASVAGSTSNAAFMVDNTGRGDLFTASKSGSTKFTIQNSGKVVVGRETTTQNPNDLLSLRNVVGANTDLTLEDGSGINRWTVFASTNGTTGFYDASNGRSPFTIEENTPDATLYIDSGGFVGFGGNSSPTQAIDVGSGGIIQTNSGQIQDYGDLTFKIDADNNGANDFQLLNGAGTSLLGINETGQLSLNGSVSNILATMDVRSVVGTQAIASFSGSTAHAGMVINNSGSGDLFTASRSGVTKFVVDNLGRVGIGDATPNADLEISSTVSPLSDLNDNTDYQLVLRHNAATNGMSSGLGFTVTNTDGNIGAAILHTRTNTNSQGELGFYTKRSTTVGADPELAMLIDDAGNVGIGTNNPGAVLDVRGDSNLNYVTDPGIYSISTGGGINFTQWSTGIPYVLFNIVDTNAGYTFKTNNAGKDLFRLDGSGIAGLGTPVDATLLATLDVRAQSGTLSIASFSGSTSMAAAIVNNTGNGDLFTASKSGSAKFVINNSGSVGIGTTNPTEKLEVANGNIKATGTTVDSQGFEGVTFVPTSPGTWSTGGSANWSRVTTHKQEGSASAEGGNVGSSQSTWLDVNYTFGAKEQLSSIGDQALNVAMTSWHSVLIMILAHQIQATQQGSVVLQTGMK